MDNSSEEPNMRGGFIQNLLNKYDRFLAILIVISFLVFISQLYFVSNVTYIGDYDATNSFVDTAQHLLEGKGFILEYLNEYFVPKLPIVHPEEYGYPLVSFLLIPFILLFGKTALAVKLPGMIFMSFGIPIVTYYLGKELVNNKIGFLAALSIIFLPQTFYRAFDGSRDPFFAFLLLLGFLFYFKGMKENKYFLVMGLFLGLSFLARPFTIVILPVLLLAYYLSRRNISLGFLKGLAVSAVVMAPWTIRNYLTYGGFLLPGNPFDSFIFGYFPYYESSHYAIWWGAAKPSLGWVISERGFFGVYTKIMGALTSHAESLFVFTLLASIGIMYAVNRGIQKRTFKLFVGLNIFILLSFTLIEFIFKHTVVNVSTKTVGLTQFIFNHFLAIPYLLILFIIWWEYARHNDAVRTVFLLWLAFTAFFSILWVFDWRMFLSLLPFLFIYSWFGVNSILEESSSLFPDKLKQEYIQKILFGLLIVLLLVSLPFTYGKFFDEEADFPWRDGDITKSRMHMVEIINTYTEKDAIIMGCYVEPLHFYTGRNFLQVPAAQPQDILAMMQTYNATYLTFYGCERRFKPIEIDYYYSLFGYVKSPGIEYNLYKFTVEEKVINNQKVAIPSLTTFYQEGGIKVNTSESSQPL